MKLEDQYNAEGRVSFEALRQSRGGRFPPSHSFDPSEHLNCQPATVGSGDLRKSNLLCILICLCLTNIVSAVFSRE